MPDLESTELWLALQLLHDDPVAELLDTNLALLELILVLRLHVPRAPLMLLTVLANLNREDNFPRGAVPATALGHMPLRSAVHISSFPSQGCRRIEKGGLRYLLSLFSLSRNEQRK